MKTNFIFALILCAVLTGCRDNQEQNSDTVTPLEDSEAVHPEQVGNEDDIQLDNGNQWQVKRATTEGVQRMREIIQNNSSRTVEEYRELGEYLSEEQIKLDRHTEHAPATQNLELYLAPLDEKIEQLQEVNTAEEGARLKSELEQHLSTYSNYFV